MKSVRLGEVVSVRGGGTPHKSVPAYYGGAIPWVTPKDMKRWRINSSEVTLTEAGVKNSPAKLVPSGSVLVVVRSGILKHTLPVALTTAPVTLNQDMKALIPSESLDGTYLARMLKAAQPIVLSWVRATTADNFPIDNLLNLEIVLPPIEEQRRIAAILDHADDLRTKRRQVLAQLDALTESTFHAMFEGTPAPVRALAELADISSGITKGRKTTGATKPVPYLAVSNVQAGRLKLDVVKEIEATAAEIDRYALRDGDLVLTEGGDPDKLGRGTVWRSELPLALHQNHIFRVRISTSEMLPDYLAAYMASQPARAYFLRSAKQTTGIASINMSQLKALPVAIPDRAAQELYLARIQAIGAQRVTVDRSLAADDELFGSLQLRAFRGEL